MSTHRIVARARPGQPIQQQPGQSIRVAVGTITNFSGQVVVAASAGSQRNAAIGMVVYRGESLATVQNSSNCNVTLRLSDGTTMFLCENAFVQFS